MIIIDDNNNNIRRVYHIMSYHRIVAKLKFLRKWSFKYRIFQGESTYHTKNYGCQNEFLNQINTWTFIFYCYYAIQLYKIHNTLRFWHSYSTSRKNINARCRLLFSHIGVSWFFTMYLYVTWYVTRCENTNRHLWWSVVYWFILDLPDWCFFILTYHKHTITIM